MDQIVHNQLVSFIWGIADDVLRDIYVRGKYRDVILPMTVIRRLDAVLESTKAEVLKTKQLLDDAGVTNQDGGLRQASGQAFYNTSPFTLRDLRARARQQQLKVDFEAYLDGFSPNVQEILSKFKFRNQIPTLVENDILGALIEKFLDYRINLSPEPVLNADGTERLPGLDNHAMGTIFEELIRRFNEENNEEAGEHFTPRDVVTLMADLILLPIADQIESSTYVVYDGACGTGGMLTLAETRLKELAEKRGKSTSIHLFGQEIQPETYAIATADLLLKGEGEEAENIVHGSTLSQDAFFDKRFDFMLSNPPYGKSWKTDLDRMGGKKNLRDPRFVITHAGDPEFSLVTRSNDGQLLFLVNKIHKMKSDTPLGSRIAEVHNGSSLFTGDAGQGESNIRRWIIENDWLEAIVALPLNMFYNTGIATYIWVISNRKPEHRRGKVQLIDATQWSQPLRKNLGKKNCELAETDIQRIVETFLDYEESEESKIFANEAFGYWKVTVDRPLRLQVVLDEETRSNFRDSCHANEDHELENLIDKLAEEMGAGPHLDFNAFLATVEEKADFRFYKRHRDLIRNALGQVNENAKPVIKKELKKISANSLHGRFEIESNGHKIIVEYEADSDLRDTEHVPLIEDGGIDEFLRREVLPYAPDAWYDPENTKIGYEINFNRYFYKPQPMRSLDEIREELLAAERKADGLLTEILGGSV